MVCLNLVKDGHQQEKERRYNKMINRVENNMEKEKLELIKKLKKDGVK